VAVIKVVVVVGEATAEEVVVAGEEGGIVKWLRLRRYILQDAGLSFSCISTWPALHRNCKSPLMSTLSPVSFAGNIFGRLRL